MDERRSSLVPVLLGAVLFFTVLIWLELRHFGGTPMPDKLETNVPGYGLVTTERQAGQSDQAYFEAHVSAVIRAGGQVHQ